MCLCSGCDCKDGGGWGSLTSLTRFDMRKRRAHLTDKSEVTLKVPVRLTTWSATTSASAEHKRNRSDKASGVCRRGLQQTCPNSELATSGWLFEVTPGWLLEVTLKRVCVNRRALCLCNGCAICLCVYRRAIRTLLCGLRRVVRWRMKNRCAPN